MKHLKTVIIGIVCAALVLGYFLYLSNRDNRARNEESQSKVDAVIAMDLENKYPKKPRAVVDAFNKILCCYYNEEYSDSDFFKMAEQQRKLLDEELLENNPEQQFLRNWRADINDYKTNKRTIESYTICGTDEVIYKEVDGRECAYVTCSYFIKDGNDGFKNTVQRYVLRKDANGDWKILVYYIVEGEMDSE